MPKHAKKHIFDISNHLSLTLKKRCGSSKRAIVGSYLGEFVFHERPNFINTPGAQRGRVKWGPNVFFRTNTTLGRDLVRFRVLSNGIIIFAQIAPESNGI